VLLQCVAVEVLQLMNAGVVLFITGVLQCVQTSVAAAVLQYIGVAAY